uniref:NADH dehydrogenase subunit 4L n=1 Tax=Ptychadena nuerensis TaxID=2039362 RepID=UPI00286A9B15|nr:NADH dehydrogenase subunit 4L [Ptychadena nuerensis]WKT09034.1 NADH dehydrogenase subunit 4L [Ptychadena nuerensis]
MIFVALFMVSLIGLSMHRTHLLSALLCLESLMLIVYTSLSLLSHSMNSLLLPLVMLTMSACDAGLGLSLMVATARSQGSDNLKTLHLLKW